MQYKDLLENINDWVFQINLENFFTRCSPDIDKHLGYKDEEIIGKTLFNFMSESEAKRVSNAFASHALNKKMIVAFENVYLHKNGHKIIFLLNAIPLYDKKNNLIGFECFSKNISKKKALQLKRLHQNQIIEQIHDAVISSDLKGNITEWNHGSQLLLGYTQKEVLGKHISLICLDKDFKLLSKNIEILIQDNLIHNIAHLITKTKEILTVDLTLSLLKDTQSNPIGIVGYAKDITQRIKAESALEQQSRLVQMGEMISMIAHQWRQPLNAISLTASNLRLKFDLEEYNPASKKDFIKCKQDLSYGLENIEDYVRNLSATVDDFRNFYKKDKETVFTKLENVIEKSLKIIGMSLMEDKIKIIKEYHSEEMLNIHENEIMQVILTIFKNAQDNFSEKGTKDPCIKVRTEAKNIFICDNGGGIPKKIINKIFEPYFSTKIDKNGTGLGLYMSKTIIENHHNGKLSAKNSNGGACLSIEFP